MNRDGKPFRPHGRTRRGLMAMIHAVPQQPKPKRPPKVKSRVGEPRLPSTEMKHLQFSGKQTGHIPNCRTKDRDPKAFPRCSIWPAGRTAKPGRMG